MGVSWVGICRWYGRSLWDSSPIWRSNEANEPHHSRYYSSSACVSSSILLLLWSMMLVSGSLLQEHSVSSSGIRDWWDSSRTDIPHDFLSISSVWRSRLVLGVLLQLYITLVWFPSGLSYPISSSVACSDGYYLRVCSISCLLSSVAGYSISGAGRSISRQHISCGWDRFLGMDIPIRSMENGPSHSLYSS